MTSMLTAATTTESQEATGSPVAEQTAPVTGEQQKTTPAEPVAEPEKAAEKAPEAPKGAPEKYEFKAPEGEAFDSEVLDVYAEVAKELNLPQESAQKVLDKVAPVLHAQQAQRLEQVRTAWAEETKADKAIGGDKLAENLAIAKKALSAFGSPELSKLLETTGLGNHPEVIRLLHKAGKAISEDSFVTGKGGPGSSGDPNDPAFQAAKLYGSKK